MSAVLFVQDSDRCLWHIAANNKGEAALCDCSIPKSPVVARISNTYLPPKGKQCEKCRRALRNKIHVDVQLRLDYAIYGTAFAEVRSDGTKRRLNPTTVQMMTRTADKTYGEPLTLLAARDFERYEVSKNVERVLRDATQLKILRELEWMPDAYDDLLCPLCKCSKSKGRAEGCELSEVLR